MHGDQYFSFHRPIVASFKALLSTLIKHRYRIMQELILTNTSDHFLPRPNPQCI